MVYHDRALFNYFVPSHREYSAQHNQSDMRAAHDWKVGFNIVEYATVFLHSDWL